MGRWTVPDQYCIIRFVAWVAPERLSDYPLPAADVPIVNAVRLPGRWLARQVLVSGGARAGGAG